MLTTASTASTTVPARPRLVHHLSTGQITAEVLVRARRHHYTAAITFSRRDPDAVVDVALSPQPCSTGQTLAVLVATRNALQACCATRPDDTVLAGALAALLVYGDDFLEALQEDALHRTSPATYTRPTTALAAQAAR